MNIFKLSQPGFILFTGLIFGLVSTLNAALLMHLPLDGNLNDISGNGNNGIFQGGSTNPGFSAAVYNQGLNFDGNNDYITVPSFDPGSTFSASLWVNHDNIGALNTFIEHANNGNNRNDFYIGYDNSNNQLTVELEDNNNFEGGACGDPKFCTGIVLNSNRWYHVVVTVTPTTLNVFIDATLAYSTTHSTTVNFGNGSWLLGGDTDNNPVTSANNDYLDGRIDEVRIYNQELSQSEISALFGLTGFWNFDDCTIANSATITDSSGNNIDATAFGGVSSTTGKICTAGLFDGSSGYVQIPHNALLNGSTALSYSAWINPVTWSGGIRQIMAKSVHGGGSGRAQMGIFSEGGVLKGRAETAGGRRDVSMALPSTGSWHHVALVFNNSTLTLYVDGSSSSTSFSSTTLNPTTDELDISKRVGTSQYFFDGAIDEVRVFNRALQTEEITGYNANPDPLNRTCPTCGGSTQTIILSTDNTETLGGLNFSDGSLAEYDPVADSSTLYFNENLFSGNEDIDAVHVLTNGTIILSTQGNATLGGLSFGDDDLVAYDPANNTATLYFDGGNLFSNNFEDIDAVYIRDNGNIILSTIGGATLGGLTFQDGDLVEYNPGTNIATLFFAEANFSGGADIDGVHLLSNGNILLSTNNTETLGGLNFSDGSIAEYNPGTNTATLYFNENTFSGGADINALTLPPITPSLDHIEFVHDGAAITCNPEPITVKACANADCSTLVSTAVSVSLSPATASSPAITWFNSDTQSITGSVNLTLQQTTVGSLTLGTISTSPSASNPVVCKNAAGTVISCILNYVNSGFIFNNETDGNTTIPTQLSAKASNVGFNAKTITLQAVRASDNDPAQCQPAFQNKTLNIDFAAECNNPANCVPGQLFNLTSAAVTGNLTATTNGNGTTGSSSYDTRSITFDASGKANIIFNYPEAGLMELHVRHNILLPDGITPSGNYMSGSSSFVVRPFALSLDVSGQRAADYLDDGSLNNSTGSNLSYSVDASGSAFTKAGVDFVTSVTAVQWQAADDANSDGIADAGANLTNNTTTTNFGKETTAILPADVIITHFSSSPNQGTFTNTANDATFTNGVANKTFNWNEVGIIDLTATLTNYLTAGNDIVSITAGFGRFTPDHFDTLVTHACNNFTYSGQPFVVTVTARNFAGGVTNNYRDTFAYGVTLSDANPAATPTGIFANNTIAFTSFSSNSATNGGDFGVGSTEVANNFTYTFTTKETLPDVLDLRATDVTDTSISSTGFAEGTTEIRSGRTRVENSFGSELVDMAVTAQVEFYNSNGFEINTADTCSVVTATLTDIGTDPITIGDGSGATQTCIRDDDGESGVDNCSDASVLPGPVASQFESPAIAGNFNLFLLAPGANNTGDIGITLNSGTSTWLQYDWDGDGNDDNDPTGVASFGLYRGDDRVIYWREVF